MDVLKESLTLCGHSVSVDSRMLQICNRRSTARLHSLLSINVAPRFWRNI